MTATSAAAHIASTRNSLLIANTSSHSMPDETASARATGQSQESGVYIDAIEVYGCFMSSERELSRCRERLDVLSESNLDCESLRREAIAYLRRTIGFDRWCWPLADPETLLPCSGLAEHNYGPGVPRSLELEYSTDAFAAKHVVARRERPVGSLSLETGGDVARSARWDEVLRPAGIGDVATVA